MSELDKVSAAIRQRYGSVYAFCRATPGLNRTTVYQVLAGKYQGDVGRQLGRIVEALERRPESETGSTPSLAELEQVIREAACSRCPAAPGGLCRHCAPGHLVQAEAVFRFLQARS
ncbi:MAG: hypothetical protein KQJ78_11195 [Deltaproteobacteria bacterium]|nr:hypothetical protein [Deltaproteobacteria bacterium]